MNARGTHSSGLPKPTVPQRIAKTRRVPDFASQGTKFGSDPGNGRFRGCFPTEVSSEPPLTPACLARVLHVSGGRGGPGCRSLVIGRTPINPWHPEHTT